jgi:hypothetical protein
MGSEHEAKREPWEDNLLPAAVIEEAAQPLHICDAHMDLPEDAIVTLEAHCGQWTVGKLTWLQGEELVAKYPGAVLCQDCMQEVARRVTWMVLSELFGEAAARKLTIVVSMHEE